MQVLRAELELTRGKVEGVKALAQELSSARVGPEVERLEQRFTALAQRISSGLVGPPTTLTL